MTAAWLSLVELRTDAGLAALGPLLMPSDASARTAAAHRLIWSLFADDPERRRDFLWREDSAGRFLVLSRRPPNPDSPVLRVQSRAFEPALATGMRLEFLLRANPTVAPRGADRRRSDVVMHALHALPAGSARAAERPAAIRRAGLQWLQRIAGRSGFAVDEQSVEVDGYETHVLPRPAGAPMRFSTLDFAGRLTVASPDVFLQSLLHGFGRARGFGCGLMLLRR